jgi:polygalacturonase
VILRGSGTIDGNGGAFRWKEYRDRPYVIRLVKCQDVTIEGLTLRDSPMWMQHYLACDRVRIRGLRVFNHASYNNDGLDLDGCHDVTVSDCLIDSDDDAIVLKSTLDQACENVTITNCVLSSHANAFKLGTESNGGFKNIAFSNSVILSPRFSQSMYGIQRGLAGIALETVDGGHLENVVISNITITGVNVALFLRLGDRGRPFLPDGPKLPVGSFRNVSISNITATKTGRTGCSITGLPGSEVQNVTLSDISFEYEGGGKRELAEKEVPERPDAYPESRMFGELPAYGLYCRHVRGLTLRNVRLNTVAPESRHAVVCDDVRELTVEGLSVPATTKDAASVLRFSQVQDAQVRGFRARGAVDVLLKLDGELTQGVALLGSDFTLVRRIVDSASNVPADAIRQAGNVPVR